MDQLYPLPQGSNYIRSCLVAPVSIESADELNNVVISTALSICQLHESMISNQHYDVTVLEKIL